MLLQPPGQGAPAPPRLAIAAEGPCPPEPAMPVRSRPEDRLGYAASACDPAPIIAMSYGVVWYISLIQLPKSRCA